MAGAVQGRFLDCEMLMQGVRPRREFHYKIPGSWPGLAGGTWACMKDP